MPTLCGIAAEEAKRCKNGAVSAGGRGVTEAQALEYCYARGFDFGGPVSDLPSGVLLVLSVPAYRRAAETPGNFILSFGHSCLPWISGQEHSLAPAPWDSFGQTGAWSSWISGLQLKKRQRRSWKIMRNVAEVYHVKRYSKQRLCNTTKALVRGEPLKPRLKEAVCEKEIT